MNLAEVMGEGNWLMTEENASIDQPLIPNDKGNVFAGCGIGCIVQAIFILLYFLTSRVSNIYSNKTNGTVIILFAFAQWTVLGPLIFKLRGKRNTVVGMVLAGVIGMMLSSGCGAFLMNFTP
jgi:hypothetical protein